MSGVLIMREMKPSGKKESLNKNYMLTLTAHELLKNLPRIGVDMKSTDYLMDLMLALQNRSINDSQYKNLLNIYERYVKLKEEEEEKPEEALPNNPYIDINGIDRTDEVSSAFESTLIDVRNDPHFYAELVNDLLYYWVHGTKETPLMQEAKKSIERLL